MSIGSFCLIKNEAPWIAPHILQVLDHIDEMVFFDGNSTDGTLEIIEKIQATHPNGKKIKLFKDRDPKDLKDDYVRLSNDAMWALSTDWAVFLHPDMFVVDPAQLATFGKHDDGVAGTCHIRSFAGEPGGQLYEIKEGRAAKWKNIYRLRNPDLGAHYFGHYGAVQEDVYFSEITGNEHIFHGEDFSRYPYNILDSNIEILHFSDVRTYERRLDRMKKCLAHQGLREPHLSECALTHPRVTLKNARNFQFVKANYPPDFLSLKYQMEKTLA